LIDGQPRVVHSELYRVFIGDFDNGGRFYGAWWQNIAKTERSEILINGDPTVERDYRQLHPTLLYAMAGKSLDGDAYAVEGWDRSISKMAFNTLINAKTRLGAWRAIANNIGGQGAYPKAQSLIEALQGDHQAIARKFGSGEGLRLQRVDAGMAETVLLRLIRRGIIALPVHDSFIVEERHAGALQEIMDDVLAETLRSMTGTGRDSIGYSENVPQYGDTPSFDQPDAVPSNWVECHMTKLFKYLVDLFP
jgi:hypothetical protein